MKCVLEDKAPHEHEVARGKPVYYRETFIHCPLLNGRQICLWCCLHICDIATPLNRGDYQIAHPEYASLLPEECGRDWDEIWQVCSKCSTV